MTNSKYLSFIRSLPCLICGINRSIEAAHTGSRGLGQKSSDFSCIPLCRNHHRTANDSYHRLGARRFAAKHSLDIPALVERLNGMGTAGLELHGAARPEASPEFARSRCLCGWRSAWYRESSGATAALHAHLGKSEAKLAIAARPGKRAPVRAEAMAPKAADTVEDLLRVAGF